MIVVYLHNNLYNLRLQETVDVCVKFQVLMAVSMKMAVFWFVAPCSLVDVYRPDDGGSKHF
jgi:hypothetical protein